MYRTGMADPTSPLVDRLDRLEKQIVEMRRRLDAIERSLTARSDHPGDRTAVREKVTFDWQS